MPPSLVLLAHLIATFALIITTAGFIAHLLGYCTGASLEWKDDHAFMLSCAWLTIAAMPIAFLFWDHQLSVSAFVR